MEPPREVPAVGALEPDPRRLAAWIRNFASESWPLPESARAQVLRRLQIVQDELPGEEVLAWRSSSAPGDVKAVWTADHGLFVALDLFVYSAAEPRNLLTLNGHRALAELLSSSYGGPVSSLAKGANLEWKTGTDLSVHSLCYTDRDSVVQVGIEYGAA